MSEGLAVRPQVTAVLAHRKASSDCCAAPLAVLAGDYGPGWSCTGCGEPCERVLGEPEEVAARG